jgi:predicted nucleotidyltransferase component of viral defense system
MTQINFEEFAAKLSAKKNRTQMLSVIKKELLHYEILNALETAQLLERLIFQGGTCLRLCYGSVRYSEDLDFAGGKEFDAQSLFSLKDTIENALSKRYDVKVSVKEPQIIRAGDASIANTRKAPREKGIQVDRWQIQVITSEEYRSIPQQKIKLEVAAIPSHTRTVRPLSINYEDLPAGYANTLLYTETLEEILADKIVSFAISPYIRYRDIWDMIWIMRQPTCSSQGLAGLVRQKTKDYHGEQRFAEGRERLLSEISDLVEGKEFLTQMKRFLPSDVLDETLQKEKFRYSMVEEIKQLYDLIS